ncbi:MAG: hypothetical protein CMC08_04070 [Flavobacteriaceae bacterium]|nr:hypothetical protein [Flavobacteriaceae bacterium]|tara:strand:+ start:256 stop:570 length:315 start_codon:yes stop_codon:yes gene_type:complete
MVNTKETRTEKSVVVEKIQLVDGDFTPIEALDVIRGLIDEKINFHKVQRLSITEREQLADTGYPDGRIRELMQEKEKAKEALLEAYEKGYQIRINGILEMEFVK